MEFLYNDEPIVACSSGNTSNCAIAVIRFSGFPDIGIFKPYLNLDYSKIAPRRAYYCELSYRGKFYDDVVATYFKGPNSYNGENILELSVHGNIINVDRIVELFIASGLFRAAHPGEFSYRALKNQKLNLSQVEGLDLLLNAASEFALSQGHSLLSGKLQRSYLRLRESFLNHLSSIEFSMDFLEDMGEKQAKKQFNDSLVSFEKCLNDLWQRVSVDSSKLLSPEIALIGQPNSGKSTLFNGLLREERAIVTKIAGTTRDYITENIKIGDVYYRLTDTAGLRESDDAIETEGIKRSVRLAKDAFFKILLVNPFEFDAHYFEALHDLEFDLILFSNSDRKGFKEELTGIFQQVNFQGMLAGPIGAENSGPIGPGKKCLIGADRLGSIGAKANGSIGAEFVKINDFMCLSSLLGEIPKLADFINASVNKKYRHFVQNQPLLLQRHKQKILEAKEKLEAYLDLVESESDISIISSEFNSIGHCISELVGIVSPDDVLHNIFDNFCIGK